MWSSLPLQETGGGRWRGSDELDAGGPGRGSGTRSPSILVAGAVVGSGAMLVARLTSAVKAD